MANVTTVGHGPVFRHKTLFVQCYAVSIEMPLTARAKMVGLFWPKASKSKAKLISCLGAMSTDVNACEELGPPEVLSIHL